MKSTLTLLLFGDSHQPVYDLHRRNTKEDKLIKLNGVIGQYFYIICILAIIFCVIVFLAVCIKFGFSATESGMMRNFVNGGVV